MEGSQHADTICEHSISKSNTNCLKLVACLLDIRLCVEPQDYRQTNDPPSSRSKNGPDHWLAHGPATPQDDAESIASRGST